ncbi:hypothetical protein [Burkholderia gladioli]|uniref:hypothetical protein n=1 Tax=Burkholderia gladioli TaxID=28095 RepID=UPI0016402C7E|nr:hypothetical protein [Burkholderia gladioli]
MKEAHVVATSSKLSSFDHERQVSALRRTAGAIRAVLDDDALDDTDLKALSAAIFIIDRLAATHHRVATIRRDEEDYPSLAAARRSDIGPVS